MTHHVRRESPPESRPAEGSIDVEPGAAAGRLADERGEAERHCAGVYKYGGLNGLGRMG